MKHKWVIGRSDRGHSELGLADLVGSKLMFLDREHAQNPRDLGEFQEIIYFDDANSAIEEYCFRHNLETDELAQKAKVSKLFPITYAFENDPIKRFYLHDRYMEVHGPPKLVTTSPQGAGYHTASWNWNDEDARRWILRQDAPKRRKWMLK